jgi:hypothetical protein
LFSVKRELMVLPMLGVGVVAGLSLRYMFY